MTAHRGSQSTAVPLRTPGGPGVTLPRYVDDVFVLFPQAEALLTDLTKVYWPWLTLTKRKLLEHYPGIAPFILPHIKSRTLRGDLSKPFLSARGRTD